jgi:predicted negative regulator of RcsB-dependent stress response
LPQLIALAVLGAGALAGYRWVAKQVSAAKDAADAAEAKLREAAEQRANAPRDLGQLEWDEVSQVYKPRR